MKKVIFFFAVLLLTVSCNKGDAVITIAAEEANRSCPMQVDAATSLEKVEYSNGTLFYSYTIDEDILPMDAVDQGLEQIAENAKSVYNLPESKELIDACKETKAKIHYSYKGSQSGKTVGFDIDPVTQKTTFHHLQN